MRIDVWMIAGSTSSDFSSRVNGERHLKLYVWTLIRSRRIWFHVLNEVTYVYILPTLRDSSCGGTPDSWRTARRSASLSFGKWIVQFFNSVVALKGLRKERCTAVIEVAMESSKNKNFAADCRSSTCSRWSRWILVSKRCAPSPTWSTRVA
jgi:hypothetical protein